MTPRRGEARTAAPRRCRAHHSRGMVTVELAVGVVTATLLAAVLAGVVLLGVVQAACQRTSSEMARQLARGDVPASRAAELQGPQGARSEVDRDDTGVEVRVSADVQIFGITPLTVSADNWAAWEPGVLDERQR